MERSVRKGDSCMRTKSAEENAEFVNEGCYDTLVKGLVVLPALSVST